MSPYELWLLVLTIVGPTLGYLMGHRRGYVAGYVRGFSARAWTTWQNFGAVPANERLADVIDADLLPPRLQDFVRLIGVSATLDLVRVYGGLRISLPTPERVTIDHPMVRIIGMDALIELAKYYGAEPHFALPKAERALLAIRNQRIAQAYSTHKTARELAAEHRLTERQVEKILAAMGTTAPVDRRQSTLF